MKRLGFTIIVTLLLLLVSAVDAEAAGKTSGTLVAATSDYLVIDTASGARRLMLLDGDLPVAAEPGERVAVIFAVGTDNRAHVLGIAAAAPTMVPDVAPAVAPATVRTPYTRLATRALESGPAPAALPAAVPGAIVALISLMGPLVAFGLAAR